MTQLMLGRFTFTQRIASGYIVSVALSRPTNYLVGDLTLLLKKSLGHPVF